MIVKHQTIERVSAIVALVLAVAFVLTESGYVLMGALTSALVAIVFWVRADSDVLPETGPDTYDRRKPL